MSETTPHHHAGRTRRRALPRLAALLAAGLALAGPAKAAEVRVMISGGFTAAYQALVPGFETKTGDTVATAYGPSMGTAPEAIPVRLARGEPADVVIMVGYALDALDKEGRIEPGSKVALADSRIALAVKAGAKVPDIATLDAFKRALLGAASIAYSDSASGVYIEKEMYRKLGLEKELAPKSRMIVAERVGNVVARGDAEFGFQQVAELKPVPGITIVGPVPPEVQKVTVFSAGIPKGAQHPEAARALIAWLSAPEHAGTVAGTGLDPISAR
ncbi:MULTISPECIES: substrate-binding domain-containing protein [Methylobacterium]|mgnify:CR=1 FL=1|jgi:molybdate transport system substrate-binding protein|uniref:substrate-binding domain-containing protein n=1 Tax=Methylobacterium TaxID=407 RepID=UPI0008E51E59|nr:MULTISPECIES: substrate-binding domain-containing protein [Methylobacterium]MBZ6412112.1 substrate-binding domain-containing protein [Methylobacterium sp.]MBK3395807.1 substrate-binding domain-containing protein [Methylobacterium ajmalii]MBK3411457.1 substrate-binding domain-containing protein [Methylobacterium ajmalii]MBK3422826.1 substrate-binding domain-containing protein [Methylobacterium ajmalii]SFF11734.1 molybdate transport system substrate-binding protein [Methylobacterium sp. yr596